MSVASVLPTVPRWKLAAERVRAKMAALRAAAEAKKAEQDALRDMQCAGFMPDEPEEEIDEPVAPVEVREKPAEKLKKPRKERQRAKRERKLAKRRVKRIAAAAPPPPAPLLKTEEAELLRGADENKWIDSQQTAEMLGMKREPRGKKHGLIRRRVGQEWQYQLASVRMALAAKIDHVLQCEATAWQAEYLQAPVVFAVPDGLVEISEACKRAAVSMKTFIKRKEKNGWKFRHLRMRAEDGTLRRITCISEFMLANYIEARNRAVFGKSDWEYSLSRRAQARNNRRRGRS